MEPECYKTFKRKMQMADDAKPAEADSNKKNVVVF